MRLNRYWCWLTTAFLAGLVFAGIYFRHALNTDAVAYLRIASYYAEGNWHLAVSGYWGPLASWLMAPLVKMGLPILVVGRGFMGISAVIFWVGCIALFRAFRLPEKWIRLGAILSALVGIYWSVRAISPDLLLAGIVGFAVSQMIVAEFKSVFRCLAGGLLWGLAYLTKAVAFPLAIVVMGIFCALALKENPCALTRILSDLGWTFLAFALVAGPWVIVISMKYGAPTISTTTRISHALTGPSDVDRYLPFARTFHKPEPGRITTWEEPSRMAYQFWSPFESPGYAWHQIKVLIRNLFVCLALLTSLNMAWPAALFDLARRWRQNGERITAVRNCERALIIPLLLVLIYLPFYVARSEQRFFFPAFPFLFAAIALCALEPREYQRLWGFFDARVWWWNVTGVTAPLLATILVLGNGPGMAGVCANDLAKRIERAGFIGPIAGSGLLPGGRTGLYVAFLLNQPWYGDELNPTPASIRASHARLMVVNRNSTLEKALQQDSDFTDLDKQLFGDSPQAARCPLTVFEIRPEAAVSQ